MALGWFVISVTVLRLSPDRRAQMAPREVQSVGAWRRYFGFRFPRQRVNPLARTLIVALLTFASGLLGFFLQWLLPVQEVAGAKDMIGSIIVFVTSLLALVLGLLVWTTYGVYTNPKTESQSLGPLILKLDFALEQYGPEADRGRDLLRAAVVRARDRFWGARTDGLTPYAQLRADLHDIMGFFATLEPTTDQQKQIITTAMPNFMEVVETTLLMTRQLANPVPSISPSVVLEWAPLFFIASDCLARSTDSASASRRLARSRSRAR